MLECDPPRRLSVTWHLEWLEEYRHNLPEAIVTFELDPLGDVVRLTMSEFHPEPIEDKYLEGGRRGWPLILSGLKSLLETGRALPKFDWSA
ncbi:MAG: SRPBCC domain-containing protein [Deltaproteobacteria bacterium]|nr:SRPBCC domain-containing protein [Deltaproteobacteria bacterium]